MQFINRKRLAPRLSLLTLAQPCTIAELIFRLEDDRRGVGWHLHHHGVGIGLKKPVTPGLDLVFVEFALLQAGNEEFPHAGTTQRPHLMAGALPVVEVTDNANAFSISGPHGESNSPRAFVGHHMRAELFIDVLMPAFAEQVQVEFAECGREDVRGLWSGRAGYPLVRRVGSLTLRLCAF